MNKELIVTPKDPGENNSQYAYRILYLNLMHLVLYPGQKLNESNLTAALGISSTPFRQALFRLQEEGLVDIRSQSGTTVPYIDYNMIQESIFIRITLESAVIEFLCRNGMPEAYLVQIQENLEIQQLFAKDPAKKERFFELDNEFHRLLFEAADKAWTYKAMCKSCAQLDRLRYANAFTAESDEYTSAPYFLAGHKDLFETILKGDASGISEKVLAHLYGGKGRLKFPPSIRPYIINIPDDMKD